MIRNTIKRYGAAAILLHWLIALLIIAEFAMGLYMTGLNYYNNMYNILPHLHESIGVVLAALILLRIIWAVVNPRPATGSGVAHWEHLVSRAVHLAMHGLMVAVVCLGYLWSTAEGDSVPVFNWFELPAFFSRIASQEDRFAFWHYWLAWTIISLAAFHAIGALKHHFVDRDETLKRMLGRY
jgi:cytochrome b561